MRIVPVGPLAGAQILSRPSVLNALHPTCMQGLP